MQAQRARRALLAAAVLATAACSGGGDGDSTDDPSNAAATTLASSDDDTNADPGAAADTSGSDDDATDAATAPATTEPPATTTTTVPPEPYPAGVVWTDPVEVASERSRLFHTSALSFTGRFEHAGDELWVLAREGNGPLVARSTDGGASWTEVTFAAEPTDQRLEIEHVVIGADGTYVAVGRRSAGCDGIESTPQFANCSRFRPVVFTSTDAITWAETAPAGFAPPGDNNLEINSVVATDDGYLASGTIIGPQWGAVLFSSPDGTTWVNERQLSNAGNRLSSGDLVWDGETLTYLAFETACGSPFRTPTGWALNAAWERHGRIFSGADIASLTLQEPGAHPLSPEPLPPPSPPPVCEGLIDDIPYSFYPYPSFAGRLVDGRTTINERFIPLEQSAIVDAAEEAAAAAEDDEEPVDVEAIRSTAGSRRWAQLVDGDWQLTEIDEVRVPNGGARERVFDLDGSIAFAQATGNGPIQEIVTITETEQVRSVRGPILESVADITAVGDTLLAVGVQLADPFGSTDWDAAGRVVVWRSAPGEGSTEPTCDLEPGGSCRGFDLTQHPDYPDFSGRDLSGVDLVAANLGSANFDGANLSGATLWLAESEPSDPPTFVDANLSGAQLQKVRIGDMSGANVSGANFNDASIDVARDVDLSAAAVLVNVGIRDLVGSNLAGADLDRANLTLDENFIDLASVTFERLSIRIEPTPGVVPSVDLSGLDLTNLRLSGPLQVNENEGVRLIITSLNGAVLDGTTFSAVDLTQVDPTIDLTELAVDIDDSICPDGLPPDGESFTGTCVRGLEE